MSTCQKLLPVILSGGAGTRLWPVSREQHPKPFMQLADGQSLLQKTFLRAAALPGVEQILTVTNRDLVFKTKDEYAQVNPTGKATAYILEPFGRNTAPALAAAALWAEQHLGPDATLLVLAADHLITKQEAFAAAVSHACALAAQGKMVTFGIQPTAPETGFGYIEAEGNTVLRFVEKPTRAKASEFLSSGRYLWNSGMFCFRVDAVLRELSEHAPSVLESVQNCLVASAEIQGAGISQVEMRSEAFEYAPDISIDYALMEPSSEVAVVPCDIGWSDIGSWNALSDLQDADAQGNRILGEALLHDAHNCYVQSPQRIVGLVGVHDLIVVDTPDAVLVADRSRAQDVKQITAQLKASGHDAYKIHREVHRPWGTYTVLEQAEDFKIKRIVVKPKGTLSLQMHHHRSEHWIVVSGIARVINGEKDMLVRTNESTYIPAGTQHRLSNPGMVDLVMIEVQSGDYLGEDDIIRFADEYGRTGAA
ncbi:mannose-1-phosphate guanylyltransferase/mannose-6-phosphate isomerase [Thiomonas sp. 13-64-67]|jgi:mannose-1-phosphate guanylyltransferase|uniref:mannose-1-phosphate guanylyltransferase/mannose-6-phosphate isomerase n=1 Tax=Thiomonas sp. 13-64-67 TaxID=1970447 RepID=UPI000BD93CC9|nr:mannose-1-phosphate guanylyltransferase/mannose-6-phosphate isomerase [Thiomonas sp. 13-64-67]OZB69806.1 MAG: mannose-1-phosphate guanylyltransferase/mannose-6-phosphate isomerase [Thiomonas sp. 13-64-67]